MNNAKNYSEVVTRFLRYIKVDTQSDEVSDNFPSTEKQKNLAIRLAQELKDIGLTDVDYDDRYGYVYASIPSNCNADDKDICNGQDSKVVGFIAHMDTSPEVTGKDVNPQIVTDYNGSDIILNEKENIILSPKDFPELLAYKGQDIITTDGTTLLGADDKAGIAEIMTMADYLMKHSNIKHGTIKIAFTPDEEVGGGMDYFDTARFGADYAYTVDGGAIGELEYENFNAAAAKVVIKGRNVHPGEAKGKMRNASLMAMEFEKLLPENEKPVYTSGYEGFYHLIHIDGGVEECQMEYIIRDHDRTRFEKKKETFINICNKLNDKYGYDCFSVDITDQYYNMKEKLEPYMFLIDNAKKVMKDLGVVPVIQPIRGGTDGARLSFMGIPCPNLCAGGHNFHGKYEYCSIQSMEKIVEILTGLAVIRYK